MRQRKAEVGVAGERCQWGRADGARARIGLAEDRIQAVGAGFPHGERGCRASTVASSGPAYLDSNGRDDEPRVSRKDKHAGRPQTGEFRGFRPGTLRRVRAPREAIRGPLRSARMTGPLGKLVREAWVVDMSYRLSPSFPLFPIYDPARVVDRQPGERRVLRPAGWSLDEHRGTHVDAPAHFGEAPPPSTRSRRRSCCWPPRWSTREWAADDHDAVVVPDDLLAWERRYGELPEHWARSWR